MAKKTVEVATPERSRPTLHVEKEDFIDGLSIGDTLTATVKMKLTHVSEGADQWMKEKEKRYKNQTFEILEISRKGAKE